MATPFVSSRCTTCWAVGIGAGAGGVTTGGTAVGATTLNVFFAFELLPTWSDWPPSMA
jgi:hypothetical protein